MPRKRKPLMGISALLILALVGCSPSGTKHADAVGAGASNPATTGATQTPTAEPKTLEAAKAVAQKELDRHAGGDIGGTWDLSSASAKAIFSLHQAAHHVQADREHPVRD
jgi:hypothetical protein